MTEAVCLPSYRDLHGIHPIRQFDLHSEVTMIAWTARAADRVALK